MLRSTLLILALFGALSAGTAVALADQPAANPTTATFLPNTTGYAPVIPIRRFVYYGYPGYVPPAYAAPAYVAPGWSDYYASPYYTYRPYVAPYYAPRPYAYSYYPYYGYSYVPRRFYYSGPRVSVGVGF